MSSFSSNGFAVWPTVISIGLGVVWSSIWTSGDSLGFWLQPFFALIVGFVFLRMTATSPVEHGMQIANGVLAAVIVVGTILGPLLWQIPISQTQAPLPAEIKREDALVSLAADVAMEKANNGITLQWPPGMTLEYAAKQADFPPAVWQEAVGHWEKLNLTEQTKFLEMREKLREQISPPQLVVASQGLGGQLVWLLVSVACAFLPASRLFILS